MKTPQILGLTFGFWTLFNVQVSEAVSLRVEPVSQTVTLGTPVTVNLTISDLGENQAPSLGGFDVNINFNPSVLELTNVTFGNQLSLFDPPSINIITEGTGTVNLYELSLNFSWELDAFQASNFTLATLEFATIDVGNSVINFGDFLLSDADGKALDAEIFDGLILVNTTSISTPEMSFSRVLLSLGILALFSRKLLRQ